MVQLRREVVVEYPFLVRFHYLVTSFEMIQRSRLAGKPLPEIMDKMAVGFVKVAVAYF